MTTVLVTGATGTIGSCVIRALAEEGVAVRAFARDADKASATLGAEVDLIVGELDDSDVARAAMEGVDAVFLSCGNNPRQVDQETTVIDAAVEAGVGRIVKLSAAGSKPGSPFAVWRDHAAIEQRLDQVATTSIVLRPTFYMSNLLGSADSIKHVGQVYLPLGEARIAMIDPLDVAAAGVAALTQESVAQGTYRLTGPTAVTLADVAAELSEVAGSTVTYVDVPDEAAVAGMVESGLPDQLAKSVVVLFGLLREGAHAEVTDDFRALTGREPRQFADFARDHAGAFRV